MQDPNSIYGLLKESAEKYAGKTAVLYDTFAGSYEKLFRDVTNKAIHLQHFEGKRVALCGPSSYRWIVNLFGIILAGKDVVLVDSFLPHKERESLLEKVGVDYILSSTNQYILADSHAIMIPGAEKDDVEGEYNPQTLEGNVLVFTATDKESDKAVVLTTQNLMYTVNAMNHHCYCSEHDRVLAQTMLFHIFGLVYSLLWPLANGACVCVGRGLRHIDAETYYYKTTILPGTPSMIEYLKRIKAFNPELRTIVIGGAPSSYKLFENLKDRNYNVYTIYGMAECSGGIAVNREMDGSYELYDDEAVQLGADGEILVGGHCVMKEYDKDEQTTKEVLKDGMFHTGDYGRMNCHGRLVITKRNPGVLQLPTGEKICRRVINEEITAIHGVAESYLTMDGDKLTIVIVPIDKEMTADRMKKKIDKYNEKKGYRWEIQKVIVLKQNLPKLENGQVDGEAIQEMLETGQY